MVQDGVGAGWPYAVGAGLLFGGVLLPVGEMWYRHRPWYLVLTVLVLVLILVRHGVAYSKISAGVLLGAMWPAVTNYCTDRPWLLMVTVAPLVLVLRRCG